MLSLGLRLSVYCAVSMEEVQLDLMVSEVSLLQAYRVECLLT